MTQRRDSNGCQYIFWVMHTFQFRGSVFACNVERHQLFNDVILVALHIRRAAQLDFSRLKIYKTPNQNSLKEN